MQTSPSPERIIDSTPPKKNRSPAIIGGIALVVAIAIALVAALGGFAGIFAVTPNKQMLRDVKTQTLNVTGTPTIILNNSAGTVRFTSGFAGQVIVQSTETASDISRAEAQQDLDDMVVNIQQSGNAITITGSLDKVSKINIGIRTIDFLVTVPPTTNLDLNLSAGAIDASGLTGSFKAQINAGSCTLSAMQLAGTSSINVNAGDISFSGAISNGGKLDLTGKTGKLSLSLPQTTAAHVEAATKVGNITITGWPALAVKESLTGASVSGDTAGNPAVTVSLVTNVGNVEIMAR